ncbi:MAG: RNA polymerase sigma-70 factor [Bacteroidota bacterium]|nr:RNA polymerase sigma-70 factor [Bacteroidota bacterium]
MNIDEENLIKRLRQDDEKAFNTLFYQYHERVYNLARRFLPFKEDAEEIVQIVFIALWENRYQVDQTKPLSHYILAIARHWIYNTVKKNIYRQGYLDHLQQQNKSLDFVTEDAVSYNELNSLVEKLTTDLPPKRSEIFRLSRNEGLSYREIASRLSITESTVNTQLTKALDYVRKNIKALY